jgi:ABC-type transport system involved in multi-copper enzyme maturation permease subunit
MLLGPVFNAELLTTARRARYYVIRFLYGLIILFQIYLSYQANSWRSGFGTRELSIQEMADLGQQVFGSFAVVQTVVVVLLTPALVGGTIAEERQRKTLHYLLTSQLTGAEIVLGKLAARLLHVGVLVALGLPVVSLVGLFGGVDFELLLLTYAGAFTTVYFLSTASILVSVGSRRPREAISILYILEIVWLIVPTLLMSAMPYWDEPWPTIARAINPALFYAAVTSPIYLLSPMSWTGGGSLHASAAWGMGLQLAYGTAFLVLAALRLRPSSRNEGGNRGLNVVIAGITRRRRWFPRPECGDDAMLWKEMHVSRTGGLTKTAMVALGVGVVGVIAYSGFGYLVPAADEMARDGYFTFGPDRREFNGFVRSVSTAIYLLWFLGIASSAATGLTSEREEDQWLSLTSTPLSGEEILRAKMIGPVWGLRMVAYLLFALWGIGLVVGSIHPLGLISCLVEFAVFTWFLTALGTFFSLRSKNSTRSLASTMALLIFLNGGYLFCCIPVEPNTPAILAGSTPVIFAMSLLSAENLDQFGRNNDYGELFLASVICVLGYGIAALALTASAFSAFDAVVDRPDRFRQDRTPNQQREFLKGRRKGIQFLDEMT